MHQMIVLEKLQKWADRNLMMFNKHKCQVLHLQRINSMHQYMLGDLQQESILQGTLVILVDNKLNSNVPLQQRRPMISMGAVEGALPAGQRMRSFLSTQH